MINEEFKAYKGREGTIIFLSVTENPFNTIKTLEKYGRYDGDDTSFIDAGIDNTEI